VANGLESVERVPGRLEPVDLGQDFMILIDYAHTPDGLKSVLETCKEVTSGKLIVVFGCGGDRDRRKRPLMGKIAAQLADYTIITSDNPRSEEPEEIIKEIEKGYLSSSKKTPYEKIVERREAIKKAIWLAEKGDTVVIAGKGHERYQIFKDKKVHFDDFEVAKDILKERIFGGRSFAQT
jgi:UDP-N-acetylmuramoyl-L-alanyl-D-glutamate--2,6-diaminopimelate ligase